MEVQWLALAADLILDAAPTEKVRAAGAASGGRAVKQYLTEDELIAFITGKARDLFRARVVCARAAALRSDKPRQAEFLGVFLEEWLAGKVALVSDLSRA